MAILEKEVWVNLVSSNVKFYENKGYEIPRYVDKYGTVRNFKEGTRILINSSDLPFGSDVELTKICDDCKSIIGLRKYGMIMKSRKNGDGKDRCTKCSHEKRIAFLKDNVKYENSLEHWAIKNNKEYLLEEYMLINEKTPSQISSGSNDLCVWKCINCKGEYSTRIIKRTSTGTNCPYCAGLKILVGFNDLHTTHPNIANMLLNKNLGYEISAGSNKKVDFKCNECSYTIKNKNIPDVRRRGLNCPRCSDGISYPEKFMLSTLEQLNINYEVQKSFEWSNRKRYDFFIYEINTIIEVHGEHHYKYTGFSNSLDEVQKNDLYKKDLANTHGIKNYIIVDARNSTLEHLKESILKSDLSRLFNLSHINWNLNHEYACHSLIKKACLLWNEGLNSTIKIGELLNIHPANIIKYLKKGTKLGWCDYEARLGGGRKSVLQFSLEGVFIKNWESAREASRHLNIGYSEISSACRRQVLSAGGYLWEFKGEEEKILIPPYVKRSTGKAIIKLDLDGKFISEYESITQAVKNDKSKIKKITSVCKGKEESYGGFKWMYKTNYDTLMEKNTKVSE